MQRKPYEAQEEKAAEDPAKLASCIASASHLTLQVAVFDRGKPAAPQLTVPFLSIPSIELQSRGQNCEAGSEPLQQEFSLDISTIALAAAPRQLEVNSCVKSMQMMSNAVCPSVIKLLMLLLLQNSLEIDASSSHAFLFAIDITQMLWFRF